MASVAKLAYVVLGRGADCHVVCAGPSVSNRHARLRWHQQELWLEDLGSANGTFIDGERVTRPTKVSIGQDVRLGEEMLPWDDAKLRTFLRHGASDTIIATPRFGRYRCTKCKKVALVPMGFKQGELSCTHCGTSLLFGQPQQSALGGTSMALGVVAALLGFLLLLGLTPFGQSLLKARRSAQGNQAPMPGSSLLEPLITEDMKIAKSRTASDMSPEEQSIREGGTARRVMEAIDADSPITRNLAVQLAAKTQGPYHVEQVVAIWLHVRAEFDYVNDPRGGEYFARASETITNGFAGDCDDFAATLAAMVTAIGGRARVIIMDGPKGGHAYAEACIDAEPTETVARLRRYARKNWNKRLGRIPALTNTYFRSDSTCKVWLNLDWNANLPGGPYGDERFAVAVESDGATETLSPADAPKPKTAAR